MTNEEILNIVKLKYSEAKLLEDGRIIMGEAGYYEGLKFVAEAIVCIKNNKIIFYHCKKNCLGYIMEFRNNVEYEFKNIIELKHILKLDITREDIVNYLEKELCSSYVDADGIGGWELKRSKYDNLIIEEYNKDGNFTLAIYEEMEDNCSFKRIFKAINSNEYWRLYNIINSLIKE